MWIYFVLKLLGIKYVEQIEQEEIAFFGKKNVRGIAYPEGK